MEYKLTSIEGGKPPIIRKGAVKKKKGSGEQMRLEDARENNPKLATFIEASMAASEKFKDRNEYQYWVCLTFQNYAQKMEFLAAMKKLGVPLLYDKYCDGEELAKAIDVPVTPNKLGPINTVINKKLAAKVHADEIERKRIALSQKTTL